MSTTNVTYYLAVESEDDNYSIVSESLEVTFLKNVREPKDTSVFYSGQKKTIISFPTEFRISKIVPNIENLLDFADKKSKQGLMLFQFEKANAINNAKSKLIEGSILYAYHFDNMEFEMNRDGRLLKVIDNGPSSNLIKVKVVKDNKLKVISSEESDFEFGFAIMEIKLRNPNANEVDSDGK